MAASNPQCEPEALLEAVQRLAKLGARLARLHKPGETRSRMRPGWTPSRLSMIAFRNWTSAIGRGSAGRILGREAIDAWHRGLPDLAPPNGETLTAMAARCASWLKSLQPSESPVLAITDAGPIRVMMAILRDEPLLTYFTAAAPFAEPIESASPRPAKLGSFQAQLDLVRVYARLKLVLFCKKAIGKYISTLIQRRAPNASKAA